MNTKGAKHLTLSDRIIIETGLTNKSTKKSIADTLGMDKSTICKEVKKHSYEETYVRYGRQNPSGTYDCVHIAECGYNSFCTQICANQERISCKLRDIKYGVCNGCDKKTSCKLTKLFYSAKKADEEYRYDLSDSRQGVNLTTLEAKALADILREPLKNGQSIYAILQAHPEIELSEKTIYTYIEEGILNAFDVSVMDLRGQVKRKIPKRSVIKYKKREDRAYLKGRTYKDFESYMYEHPSLSATEMDTVYNDGSNGPFIQTFILRDYGVLFGVLHQTKTAQTMVQGVKSIKDKLGEKLFSQLIPVILTDRGTEFSDASGFEEHCEKVFYCDPMCSWQKPHVENVHKLLRYICPKEKDLFHLGLRTQEDLDLIFSHINSYPREERRGKSPFDELCFYEKEAQEILSRLNLKIIDPNSIILNPSLIKK